MNILLTGAASGIGNALFKEYQSLGHHIYGIDFQEMNPEEHLTEALRRDSLSLSRAEHQA